MSDFKLNKKFNKKKVVDTVEYYDFYDINGNSTVSTKYIYVPNIEPGMCLVYETSNTGIPVADATTKPILLTGKLTTLNSPINIRSAVISKLTLESPTDYTDFNANRDGSILFELFDSVTLDTITKMNSLVVQRNFPNSKTYQLMNGSVAKYTPYIKHNISISMSYLTSSEFDEILNYIQDPVLIAPENDSDKSPFHAGRTEQIGGADKSGTTITIDTTLEEEFGSDTDIKTTISSFNDSKYFHWMDGTIDRVIHAAGNLTVKETITGDPGNKNQSGFKSGGVLTSLRNFDSQGYFYCNFVGNSIDFQYTTRMKNTGYSGTLNFQEI